MSAASTSRAAIERDQLERLRALVAALVPANPFWSARLAAAGLAEGPADLAELRRLPLLDKAELALDHRAHPPFGSNLTAPIEDYVRVHHTSGTTGEPLAWPDTRESWQWMLDSWKIVHGAAGVTERDSIFFAFSFGPFLGFWTAFEAALQIGARCLSGGGLGSEARLAAMARARSTVLCCTPTYALHLVETARRMGLARDALALETVIVAGEPGGSIPAVRDAVRAGLGAELFDHHGMTEVGPVTYQCPGRPGRLRVIESAYLAEVIVPESGAPAEPGATGELVLTTLGRTACPLLRYRTGDLVRPVLVDAQGADGGPHLALDGGVLGRADDMVIVRGVNVYPSAMDHILRGVDGLVEYRVRVGRRGALAELSVEVEPAPGADAETVGRSAGERLARDLALRVPVRVTAVGALPRFEMKARRWVRDPEGGGPS